LRVLLDNCVRIDLKPYFTPLEVLHTLDLGWEELRNGDLLRQANERFDIVVTVDKNMRFQSNLRGMRLRVAVLDVKGNDFTQLIAATEILLSRIERLPEGEFSVVNLQP
jgi:predicted nuclease of predicted toxin-antitoxin system